MRITAQDVMVQVSGINEILEKIDSEYRIQYNGRYGYNVIERVYASTLLPHSYPMCAGTTRECYNYAAAMLRGMWLARKEY